MKCGAGKMQLPACCANHLARATQEHLFKALFIFNGCPWTSWRFLIYNTASFSQTSIPLPNGVVVWCWTFKNYKMVFTFCWTVTMTTSDPRGCVTTDTNKNKTWNFKLLNGKIVPCITNVFPYTTCSCIFHTFLGHLLHWQVNFNKWLADESCVSRPLLPISI
jgi:hypothetical protein